MCDFGKHLGVSQLSENGEVGIEVLMLQDALLTTCDPYNRPTVHEPVKVTFCSVHSMQLMLYAFVMKAEELFLLTEGKGVAQWLESSPRMRHTGFNRSG